MSLSIEDVRKIAGLARIKMTNEQVEKYQGEINGILKWIEQLQEVNTDGVEPMAGMEDHTLPLRADVVSDGNKQAEVIANAPVSKYGFFVVPKVIE